MKSRIKKCLSNFSVGLVHILNLTMDVGCLTFYLDFLSDFLLLLCMFLKRLYPFSGSIVPEIKLLDYTKVSDERLTLSFVEKFKSLFILHRSNKVVNKTLEIPHTSQRGVALANFRDAISGLPIFSLKRV